MPLVTTSTSETKLLKYAGKAGNLQERKDD